MRKIEDPLETFTAWVDLRCLPRRSRFATLQVTAPHTTTVIPVHKEKTFV